MTGALDGVRVLDFGQYIAGPMAAMLLADQGAEVIHIDPPGGPRWETPANEYLNRGKLHVQLDLKSSSDLEQARALVARCDVLIENFRPGVMERLGLGHERVLVDHPSVIYCSLPGFGEGDSREKLVATEGLLMAAGAVSSATVDPPTLVAVPIPSVYGALFAATALAAALVTRGREGIGQRIEVPLFDATLGAHGFKMVRVHGAPPLPNPDARQAGVHGWMGEHECQDLRHVFFHTGTKEAQTFLIRNGYGGNDDLTQERIAEVFGTRDAQAWEDLGVELGVEVVRFRTVDEWLAEPLAHESGLVISGERPGLGAVHMPGWNATISGREIPVDRPRVSRATTAGRVSELLSEPAKVHPVAHEEAGSPLGGLRVVEVSHLIAGPICGRTLAEYGAEVTKVDNPHAPQVPGDWAASYEIMNIDLNRGKKRMTLDLKTEEGAVVLRDMIRSADILVHNYRPGVLERLGLGYGECSRANPGLIYAHITAYGRKGALSRRPGHEHAAQAITGVAAAVGGIHTPSMHHVRTPCDSATGILAAFAIIAAVHGRGTGPGCEVDVSLAGAATLLQIPVVPDDGPAQRHAYRWEHPGTLDGLYQTSDGWLFIGGPAEAAAQLLESVGAPASNLDVPRITLARQSSAFSTEEWASACTARCVPFQALADLAALKSDPELHRRGAMVTRSSDRLGLVDQLAPVGRLSRSPLLMER